MQKADYTYIKNKMDEIISKYAHKKDVIVYYDKDNTRHNISYREFGENLQVFAEKMRAIGLKRADRVAVICKFPVSSAYITLNNIYNGYTSVMIDASLPIEEINRLLVQSDVSVVFTTEKIYNGISNDIKLDLPFIEIGEEPTKYKLFDNFHKTRRKPIVETNKSIIGIIFSSGTTDTMKGVEITYDSIQFSLDCGIEYTGWNKNIKFLHVLPINHITGFSMIAYAVLIGAELGFIYETNAYYLAKGLQQYNPNCIILIPKIYEIIKNKIVAEIENKNVLLRKLIFGIIRFSGFVRKTTGIKLRFLTKPIVKGAFGKNMLICGCGTTTCPQDVVAFYLDLGLNFSNVYGATETSFPITATNPVKDKYPLVGTGNVKQFDEIDVIITNKNDDGIGEIRVKTRGIMNGYFRSEQLTKDAFDSNGYFKTGDNGFIDENNLLHITGRIKESVVLSSGKKVSPADVDNYYQQVCGDVNIASCGMTDKSGMYDELYIFIETKGQNEKTLEETEQNINKLSLSQNNTFKVSKVLYIDTIPKTSIGKVKRFLLQDYVKQNKITDIKNNSDDIKKKSDNCDSTRDFVYDVIEKITGQTIERDDTLNLINDLGIESLDVFTLYNEIENKYHINIAEASIDIKAIGDIISAIENSNATTKTTKRQQINLNDYPLKKSMWNIITLKIFMGLCRFIYKFEVVGKENLIENEQYIFCPNHESNLDGLFLWTALRDFDISKISCLAKQELTSSALLRISLKLMGGIPIDRTGNSAPAMKRALKTITEEKGLFYLHPEGTRTRNGKIGKFKNGASILSIESGVKIVPVCIDGAYRIYPPKTKLPKIFNWKKFRRYKLGVSFGKPISPEEKNEVDITKEIKSQIIKMKELRRK